MHKPFIAWEVLASYLPRTETFIHTAVRSLRGVRPVIVSYGELLNLEEFPLPDTALFSLSATLSKPRYYAHRALSKFKDIDWIPQAEVRECRSIASQHPPKVIHAHFGPIGRRALELKRALGVPLVTTFYGFDTNPNLEIKNWQRDRQQLFEGGDLFLAEGPFMRDSLIAVGCPSDRVKTHRIGIDLSSYPIRQVKKAPPRPIILFAARFVEKKGLEYGLEAIALLQRAKYQFECRIIGNGPLEDKLRGIVRERQLDNVVTFLGSLNHASFIQELSRASIFVQPSVTAADGDREGGAPTSVLEAQACNTPVVATRHADIPNVVWEGHSALLVRERDSAGLAQAISLLLERSADWAEMGNAGRKFVEQHHRAEDLAVNLERMYAQVAGIPEENVGSYSGMGAGADRF